MKKNAILFLCLALVLSACNGNVSPTSSATPTSGLPTPIIDVSQAPDVEEAARAYLEAWKTENYEGMYALLSKLSRDAMTLEDFQKRIRCCYLYDHAKYGL